MLVLATGNKGKLAEFRRILPDISIVPMREAGFTEDIIENGTTFEENALLKARAVWQATGRPSIADDSGLMVDALGGAPGVYSARYAGEDATDAERMEKLLGELSHIPKEKRGAAFVSVIAYIDENGKEQVFRGECRGVIAEAPMGTNGFGYDPVFYIPEFRKTFGELSEDEKNQISHRGRALKQFKVYMENK